MKNLFFLLITSILISCTSGPESNHPRIFQDEISQEFHTLLNQYWDDLAPLAPIDATSQGDFRYNDSLPDFASAEFRNTWKAFSLKYLSALKKISREKLSSDDQTSYDMLTYDLNLSLEEEKFASWKIPFHQFWGIPLTIGQLGSGESYQPFKTFDDYLKWIKRFEGFQQWSKSAIANFKLGIKSGYVLPATLVIKMIQQMENMIQQDYQKSLFYGPVKNIPKNLSKKETENIALLYKSFILEKVNPTFQNLAQFLKQEYLPKARKTSGLSELPGGKAYYRYLVKSWTTTNLSPEFIYQTGLKEVTRIKNEMLEIKTKVGFKGDLKSFFDHLRNDPQFMPYKNPQEVLNAFYKIHETITPQLSKLFSLKPKTAFEIKQVEAFRAATASAEYQPGTPDGKRPGIFYIPILDATKFNITSGMESLFLHEAIPGHHYQISLQQENNHLPLFRKFSWYGAYGEGWALYTESLGKELGLYTDPYQYMGALGDEMHRALRLVVDVAIHLKGMSREKAIKYLMDHEPISQEGATAEIERYMAIPGQALSYKVGSLKIWELRKKYEKKLGPKFSIASFHTEILKDGCMPLETLERKLEVWANLMDKN